jgi:hypothetical protein
MTKPGPFTCPAKLIAIGVNALRRVLPPPACRFDVLAPVTDHATSDDCGTAILGSEDDPFWKDRTQARRTRCAMLVMRRHHRAPRAFWDELGKPSYGHPMLDFIH